MTVVAYNRKTEPLCTLLFCFPCHLVFFPFSSFSSSAFVVSTMIRLSTSRRFLGGFTSGFSKGFNGGRSGASTPGFSGGFNFGNMGGAGGSSGSGGVPNMGNFFGGGNGGNPLSGFIDQALEWCSTSHAYDIAQRQGIDVRNIKFEKTPEGGVNVVVDAPNATPLQIEQLGKQVQEECPVARFRKTSVKSPQQQMKWMRLPPSYDR